MSLAPLLVLGGLLLLSKKKGGATVRVVEREPESVTKALENQLPVFNEEQVYGPTPSSEVVTQPRPVEQAAQSVPEVEPLVRPAGPAPAAPPAEFSRAEEAVFQQPGSEVPPLPGAEVEHPEVPTYETPTAVQPVPADERVEVVRPDPAQAARELAAYVSENRGKPVKLGLKNRPNETVQALQLQMGEVDADGIYGPKTRRRGEALGVSMPARK